MRVLTMNLMTVGFFTTLGIHLVLSLLGDRATYRRGNLHASWRRFRQSPLLSAELWRTLRDYNRHDFHPDDFDSTELVEHWRAELFGANGTLNALLA